MRGGRVVERIELASNAVRRCRRRRPTCWRRRCSSSTKCAMPPPEMHLPVATSRTDDALEGVARRNVPGRRVQLLVPQRGDRKRGLVDLATRNADARRIARMNQRRDHGGALRGARDAAGGAGAADAAAPHRVLRHLHDPGQRDGGLDGRCAKTGA